MSRLRSTVRFLLHFSDKWKSCHRPKSVCRFQTHSIEFDSPRGGFLERNTRRLTNEVRRRCHAAVSNQLRKSSLTPSHNFSVSPSVGPYGVCVALPLRVHHEVSQASSARRDWCGGPRPDSGICRTADIEILQGHVRPDHVHLLSSVAPPGAEPGHAGDQGEGLPSSPPGSAAAAGGVLGSAPVGARLLRVQQRPSHRPGDCAIHCPPGCRARRRRSLPSQRDVSLHGAAMASLQSTSVESLESLALGERRSM
jgi:hypothetical protein